MFGIGFRSKVISVLRENFNYPVASFQMSVLRGICEESKNQGMNEYDAAIKFMVIQMNTLDGEPEDVNLFVKIHSRNINAILDLASRTENEISNLLTPTEITHEITESEV